MGVANPAQGQMIAEVFRELGRSRALVVHGAGTDEIAVHGTTQVWELKEDGEIISYEMTPEELGVQACELTELVGGDGVENATHMRAIFDGSGPVAHRNAVAVNAGAMFYLNSRVESLREGTEHALQLLADGTVAQWLNKHEEIDYRG